MKKITLLAVVIILFACAAIASAQDVTRLANESPEDFAKRNAPAKFELLGKVVESNGWNTKKSIFAFYRLSEGQDSDVDGFVFIPTTGDSYEKVKIGTIGQEGGTANIEAVFFANADKDAAKELIIISSFHQQHMNSNGELYETAIYDDIPSGKHPAGLKYLKKISEKVSGGCDCQWSDDPKMKADKRFETAAQVTAGLKKLGF